MAQDPFARIALIETDYLCCDILGMDGHLSDLMTMFPVPDRDEAGELVAVTGVALPEHLARFDIVREYLLEHVSKLTAEQVDEPRSFPEWDYDTFPAWTLDHLMQHEAAHRGEIGTLRTIFKAQH